MGIIHQERFISKETTSTMDQPKELGLTPAKLTESPATTYSEPHHEVSSRNMEPPSRISELQDAFGTLLLTSKKTEPVSSYNDRFDSTPILPKWTGTFALFSFPRELRDRIYYHYLYRPKGILYAKGYLFRERRIAPRPPNKTNPHKSNDITALFLTSRQVYDEALQAFCRYNQIEIYGRVHWRHRDYGKAPRGILRLFPEKARTMVQRIRNQYGPRNSWLVAEDGTSEYQTPREVFIQVLRDAYIFKNTFPMLREFTAAWDIYGGLYQDENIELDYEDLEQDVDLWLGWMRRCVEQANVVPPPWVRFQFSKGCEFIDMQVYAASLNKAYARLVNEMPARTVDPEESGKKWIEEMAMEKRKKRNSR
jgi:hypothetical protein